MDSGELLERINTLIEGQKIARGDMLYRGHADAELVEAAARILQYQARIEALEIGLKDSVNYMTIAKTDISFGATRAAVLRALETGITCARALLGERGE